MSKSGLGKSNDSCVKGLHPFPHLFAKLSVFLGCIFFKKKTRNSFTKQCTNESECCEEVIYCANIWKKVEKQRIKRLTSSVKGQLMTLNLLMNGIFHLLYYCIPSDLEAVLLIFSILRYHKYSHLLIKRAVANNV